MPQDYYSLITDQGLIKEAASNEPSGAAIDLTEIAVGDGGGVIYDPVSSATALVNEVYRIALTHVVIDENNPNQLIVEGVLDETIGPFYIREVGIFDSNGDLFAIGKYPETFKPNLPSGSGKRLYIRMILGFANAPNINLVINNDIALDPNFGTDVNNALAERLVKTNNLSDLDDVSVARDNLDVYSKAEVDDRPVFKAIIDPIGQTFSTGITTKVQFDTKVFDDSNWYDNATNYRFTPLKAGKYLVIAKIQLNNTQEISDIGLWIYKNGSVEAQFVLAPSSAKPTALLTSIIDMNGSSDYLEIFFKHNLGSDKVAFTGNLSEFSASYLSK